MKKWLRNLLVLFLFVAAVGVSVLDSHAQATDTGSGQAVAPAEGPRHGLFASLGLTDEQKAQIKGIFQNHRTAAAPLVQQLRAQGKQLKTVIETAPVDEAAIRAQAAQVSTVKADLAVLRAHLIQDILGVLTPAQVQQLTANGGSAAGKIDRFVSRMTRHRAKG